MTDDGLIIHGYHFTWTELEAMPRYWNHRIHTFDSAVILARAYQAANFDARELARRIGCGVQAVYAALTWYGLWLVDAGEPRPRPGYCKSCGIETTGELCQFCQADANRILYHQVTGPACPSVHKGKLNR